MIPLLTDVLIKGWQTEKTVGRTHKYMFQVHPRATKPLIKEAIKKFYGVEVEKINTMKNPRKIRLIGRGREAQKRAEIKKAEVTSSSPIDFNAFK